jgi:SAM-dependent methyltransferase
MCNSARRWAIPDERHTEGAVGFLHKHLVFSRRTRILAQHLSAAIPADTATLLDVGCGDGTIDALLLRDRPALSIAGVDVLLRPDSRIPVHLFDGKHLPFNDNAFDTVTFVDVLHHTADPAILLKEARRVARIAVVLKDHVPEGLLAYATLRFMDSVGNAHHGVVLPYNYWTRAQWRQGFESAGLTVAQWTDNLRLYPPPASWIFERKLHFVTRLTV